MITAVALLLLVATPAPDASATANATPPAAAAHPSADPDRAARPEPLGSAASRLRSGQAPRRAADAESKGDASLGLSRTGVFDVPTPPAVHAEDAAPGEKPAPPRAYPGAPPAIPHGIADFLPITRAQNLCVDCHAVKQKKPGEATPIPPSHYRDLRRAPGALRPQIAGARQVCTACHATRSDAAPLVGNTFGR